MCILRILGQAGIEILYYIHILVVIILKKAIFAKIDTFHLNVEISFEKRRKGKTRKKSLSNGI
jgi:hypothetical protein